MINPLIKNDVSIDKLKLCGFDFNHFDKSKLLLKVPHGLRHGDNIFSGLDSQVYFKGWKFFDGISSTIVEFPPFALDEYLISLHRVNQGIGTNLRQAGAVLFMLKEALQYNVDFNHQDAILPIL